MTEATRARLAASRSERFTRPEIDAVNASDRIRLTGSDLTLEAVERVARSPSTRVTLDDAAREAMRASRELVEELLASDEKVYGLNTGFGGLSEVRISREDTRDLQLNLVRSHAAGVGEALSREAVRALMLLRANALALGRSGCRPVVVERLLDLLNAGLHPLVPSFGSVGASGDLAPLAHVARALIGEGAVEREGETVPADEALAEACLEPLDLRAKEGLALINGTQATTALGILALLAVERAIDTADVAGATSLEGLRGTPDAFRREVQEARPHPGQARTAARLRALMAESEIRESHRTGDPRVQDAYSIRCMPQVHGAAREAAAHARRILETEANSATDNPLVFVEDRSVVSAGNFHAQVVAQVLDLLCVAVADLAAVSERRTERLLNPDLSGHPAFLAEQPGLESGFMIAQVTAADLVGELRVLAHPASVDSVPTSANQEDHISMGMGAARKALRAAGLLSYVLTVELMCAVEAVERLAPLAPGRGVARALEAVRERVPPLEGDRPLSGDLETLAAALREGTLAFPELAEEGSRT